MTDIQTWLKNQQQHSKLKRFDLELLLLGTLKVERSWLFSHADDPISESQQQQLTDWVNQAQNGKPIAYILGHKDFWTLKLNVTPATLIPRPETEQIIELAMALPQAAQHILDLGTGSGAIALSLAKEWPSSEVSACDFSKDALAVAAKNAVNNHINNVSFFHSDWFSAVPTDKTFDLIVSNPPYVDPNDAHLADLTFEPITALTAENNGLKDLQTITTQAIKYLRSAGYLMLEHGYDQGLAVRNMLNEAGYHHTKTHKDLAGHDRITVAQKPKD